MYIHTSSRYKRSLCGYQEQSQHLTAWQETPEASVLFLLSLALLMTSKEMLIYRDDVEPVARIMRNFGHIFHHSCFWNILTNHDTYRTNTWNDISNDTYEAPMSVHHDRWYECTRPMSAQGEDQVTSVTCLHPVFLLLRMFLPIFPWLYIYGCFWKSISILFGPPNCHHRKRVVRLANESLDEHLVVWDSVRLKISRQLGRDFELKRAQDATGQPNQGESRNKEGTGRIKMWVKMSAAHFVKHQWLNYISYNLMFFCLVFFFTLVYYHCLEIWTDI